MLVPTFDYHLFPASTQQALQDHAVRLGELARGAAEDLWRMGQILADAQEHLASYGTGTFLNWLEAEARLNYRMAYRLINVYRSFDFDILSRTRMGPTVLYALSEPSTPPQARQEAIERAEQGETITNQVAREIIETYAPKPAPLPEPPDPEPPPEYIEFEREELLPKLHDAQVPDAPQLLSGKKEEIQHVSKPEHERVEVSLRESIIEQLAACQEGKDIDECADELLEIMGQSSGSIALAAHFGISLSAGPLSLVDLTEIACKVNGDRPKDLERDQYLAIRKKVLRLIDALTYTGCGIYEHTLSNRQLVYSLIPCDYT